MKGVGIDFIETKRIEKALKTPGLLERLFTTKERAYFGTFKHPLQTIAGRFAAKEAVAKALGTGFGKDLEWQDIEITNEDSGKPCVYIKNKEKEHFLLSISHSESAATAIAIWL